MEQVGPKRGRGHAAWMHANELSEYFRENRAPLVVDIREAPAYAAGHIPNAVNLPERDTAALVRAITIADKAVLVCDDSEMSQAVARTLDFCGFTKVAYLHGGLKSWMDRGLPVVRATSKQRCVTPPPAPAVPYAAPAPVTDSIGSALNCYVVGAAMVGSVLVILLSLWVMKLF